MASQSVTRRQRIANALEPAIIKTEPADDEGGSDDKLALVVRKRQRRTAAANGRGGDGNTTTNDNHHHDDDDEGAAVDDDGAENEYNDGFYETRSGRRRRRNKPRPSAPATVSGELDLPGATARRAPIAVGKPQKVGELSEEMTLKIRRYLDMLLGSVLIEARRLVGNGHSMTMYAIPNVVCDILEYNNLRFATVKFALTKHQLFEPIDYVIDQSTLTLVVNESMYNEYCLTNNSGTVIFPSGLIPIDRYNPPETDPSLGEINYPVIRCAIACDHVAQHILYDVYGRNQDRPATAGIHEYWTDVDATTLHSMFRITRVCTEEPVYSSHYTHSGSFGGIGNASAIGVHNLPTEFQPGNRFAMPTQPTGPNFSFLPPGLAFAGFNY